MNTVSENPASRRLFGLVSLVIAVIVLSSSTINAAPTRAATNNPGGLVEQPEVDCDSDDMWVGVPVMEPAPVQYNDGGFTVGNAYSRPAQWVGFRASLAWWNGAQWSTYRQGTWFYQQATTAAANSTGYSDGWYDLTTSNPLTDGIGFWDLPNSGDYDNPNYYAVYYEYYWWADNFRDSGYSWDYTHNHKDLRGQPQGTINYTKDSTDFCKYPGPNWVSDVN